MEEMGGATAYRREPTVARVAEAERRRRRILLPRRLPRRFLRAAGGS